MDQSNKFGEPSPSTTPEQTLPPRASLPSNFTRSVPGDPRSHGSIAHHPRHQPPPPIPDLQGTNMGEEDQIVHKRHGRVEGGTGDGLLCCLCVLFVLGTI